ncbi:MAG: response regulator [Candidatus Omnitrophica bacterium]|nr:response regulator [Candidatus Omnitrophota bacterium]
MKILIVDDSLLDRKLLSRTLVNAGVKNEIVQAENGEAALGIIAQHMGDLALIFLDYQMPNMSGIELMDGLVKIPATAGIPMVMVTASASDESKLAAYKINPKLAGYVLKPFKLDILLATIKPYVQF